MANSLGKSRGVPQGYPLSTRTRSGRPQRAKTRRNISWISVAGTCSQRRWGESSAARMAPEASSVTVSQETRWVWPRVRSRRRRLARSREAGPPRGRQRRPRDVAAGDGRRPGRKRPGGSGPRGSGAAGVLAELEPDQPGPPGGMLALEFAGDAEQLPGGRRDRSAVAGIAGDEPVEAMATEQPPDLPDSAVGDRQSARRSESVGYPADDDVRSPGGAGRGAGMACQSPPRTGDGGSSADEGLYYTCP